ncbi:MAG: DUF4260 family protein [Erythrobacter sp.]|nr:MAG: DUF4260 family protein [Erythrobacter sp.]
MSLLPPAKMFLLQDGGFAWWVTLAAFFAPGGSIAAYAFGSRIGAIGYNLLHIYGFGAVVLALGMAVDSVTLAMLGALWLDHSGFDRLFGYGLKSRSGFRFTHLGIVRPLLGK